MNKEKVINLASKILKMADIEASEYKGARMLNLPKHTIPSFAKKMNIKLTDDDTDQVHKQIERLITKRRTSRLQELAGVQLNEETEELVLRELDKHIDKAIIAIANFYENEGDDPIEARQAASDTVHEHLKNQRT